MTDRLLLPPAPASVPAARHFVRTVLQDVPPDVGEIIELLVSELATNCVVHARSDFQVRVVRSPGSVRVEVADDGGGEIVSRRIGDSEPHGRGLRIVEYLADQWGVIADSDSAARTVWFQLATRQAG